MGKTIHSAKPNLVLKVIKFFDNEKQHGCFTIPVEQATKRACAATGLSKTTIMIIKNEAKKLQVLSETSFEEDPQPSTSASVTTDTIKLSTPGKKRKKYKKKIDLDSFDLCAIRSLVESFYTTRKEIPTLKKILRIAKQEQNFPGQKDALRNILINSLGYRFKKCKRKRDFLVQRPEIAAWRAKYLRRLKENDERGAEKKPVTFIDETWIHSLSRNVGKIVVIPVSELISPLDSAGLWYTQAMRMVSYKVPSSFINVSQQLVITMTKWMRQILQNGSKRN